MSWSQFNYKAGVPAVALVLVLVGGLIGGTVLGYFVLPAPDNCPDPIPCPDTIVQNITTYVNTPFRSPGMIELNISFDADFFNDMWDNTTGTPTLVFQNNKSLDIMLLMMGIINLPADFKQIVVAHNLQNMSDVAAYYNTTQRPYCPWGMQYQLLGDSILSTGPFQELFGFFMTNNTALMHNLKGRTFTIYSTNSLHIGATMLLQGIINSTNEMNNLTMVQNSQDIYNNTLTNLQEIVNSPLFIQNGTHSLVLKSANMTLQDYGSGTVAEFSQRMTVNGVPCVLTKNEGMFGSS